jgi:hypothetical protein
MNWKNPFMDENGRKQQKILSKDEWRLDPNLTEKGQGIGNYGEYVLAQALVVHLGLNARQSSRKEEEGGKDDVEVFAADGTTFEIDVKFTEGIRDINLGKKNDLAKIYYLNLPMPYLEKIRDNAGSEMHKVATALNKIYRDASGKEKLSE